MRRLIDRPERPAIIDGGTIDARSPGVGASQAAPGKTFRSTGLLRRRDHRHLPPAVAVVRPNYAWAGPRSCFSKTPTVRPLRCLPPHVVRRQAALRPAAALTEMRAGVGCPTSHRRRNLPAVGQPLHEISEGNDSSCGRPFSCRGDGAETDGVRPASGDVDLALDYAQAMRARTLFAQSQRSGGERRRRSTHTIRCGDAARAAPDRQSELVAHTSIGLRRDWAGCREASASLRPVRVGVATGPLADRSQPRMTMPTACRRRVTPRGLGPDADGRPPRRDDDRPVATIVPLRLPSDPRSYTGS